MITIDVETLRDGLLEGRVIVIDVRSPEEFAADAIQSARNIPIDELSDRLYEIPRRGDVAVVCAKGSRSARAAQYLLEHGFHNVINVEGGTEAWNARYRARREGRPKE